MKDADTDEAFIHGVGSRLHHILNGDIDALTVFQESGLANYYEESMTFQHSAKILTELVAQLSVLNPSLRILEIGAGTGGFTARILDQLDSRFESYSFTDISAAFLPAAKDRFHRWASRMTFQTLEISRDHISQGFEAASFDLLLAADVIHATPSIHETLKNMRMLLKPHGALALVELSAFTPLMLPFTTLPSWWSRSGGPILSEGEWREELLNVGFNSANAYFRDLPDGHDRHCVIWARSAGQSKSPLSPVTILSHEIPLSPANALQEILDPCNQISRLENIGEQPSGWYICLEDVIRHPILTAPTREEFQALQRLYANAKGILWVTISPDKGHKAALAEFAFGFVRTIRAENTQLKFVVLHVSDSEPSDPGVQEAINSVFYHAFAENPENHEVDFKWHSSRILFPRLVPDNDMRAALSDQPSTELQPFWRKDRRTVQARIWHLGALDSLHFETVAVKNDDIGDEEVLIEVRATGLNFKDVLIALGRVPWSSPGKECSGVVLAAGVTARRQLGLKPGDAVILWGDGLFASHVHAT